MAFFLESYGLRRSTVHALLDTQIFDDCPISLMYLDEGTALAQHNIGQTRWREIKAAQHKIMASGTAVPPECRIIYAVTLIRDAIKERPECRVSAGADGLRADIPPKLDIMQRRVW